MIRYVTLGGREVAVTIEGDRVLLDGRPVEARLERVPGSPVARLVLDGRAHDVLLEGQRGQWQVTLRGERWTAAVEDERQRAIRALAPKAATQQAAALKAPMPGLVVRVLVQPGDAVQAGQGLVVLEAMKMENELKAAAAGTVRAVLVQAGAAVAKGAVLVEMGS
ncbi:MAG: biotin/lipoyl-containing protein [Gemmatimonadales bacterium]|nr:biotin/lipoyl-containing protein [Gemmatimonadales bacterium]